MALAPPVRHSSDCRTGAALWGNRRKSVLGLGLDLAGRQDVNPETLVPRANPDADGDGLCRFYQGFRPGPSGCLGSRAVVPCAVCRVSIRNPEAGTAGSRPMPSWRLNGENTEVREDAQILDA